MLKIDHLSKRYGDKPAVDDLSIHIAKGTIYGFIGHNGAGKTTTIKACAGILSFDSGDIHVDGISIKDNPLEAKKKWRTSRTTPIFMNFIPGFSI